ncbi:DUF7093 family protein [Natronomonas salsuginis]|uniref:Uncharacterized protein n=1 Tax=Natronomonas salsuginis TaxID=2217661 RepID=A0A4U5JBU4_9EURY|nr:hypothetical protein [Natronomonas salsuginis]TKR25751.1 hypothetical protein DM868_10115 [Natronomonas salsuginis]
MGLRCSILGHAFEDAGVEREREEQGSEVVTTEREIEQCRHCGAERVVSENTEVAAVVDADDVGIEPGGGDAIDTDDTNSAESATGGIAGAVERSGVEGEALDNSETTSATAGTDEPASPASPTDAEAPLDAAGDDEGDDYDETPPDPETEDAEILTDDDDEQQRRPGQWPDDPEDSNVDTDGSDAPLDPGNESLSGLTVPEGRIVCPECSFSIEANSGYREGDPCPECNAWLEAERNQ